MNPCDHSTWKSLHDHPIFGESKFGIERWSLDPSRYDDLKNYRNFIDEYYVHIDPPPSVQTQADAARCDLANLAAACSQIETEFPGVRYELVILDDFTVYVWLQHEQFEIELYPQNVLSDDIFSVFVDRPEVENSEIYLDAVAQIIPVLRKVLSGT